MFYVRSVFRSVSMGLRRMFYILFFTHCFRTTIYAPHGLSKIISATHHFMRFDTTKVQLHLEELKENNNTVYSDEEIKIHPITLTGVKSTVPLCYDRCSAASQKYRQVWINMRREIWQRSLIHSLQVLLVPPIFKLNPPFKRFAAR